MGDFSKSRGWCLVCLDKITCTFESYHWYLYFMIMYLLSTLSYMSCCRSAEASYKQTLAINENALGKEHPLVAKVLYPTLCLNYIF
jgi:hypothetical protein